MREGGCYVYIHLVVEGRKMSRLISECCSCTGLTAESPIYKIQSPLMFLHMIPPLSPSDPAALRPAQAIPPITYPRHIPKPLKSSVLNTKNKFQKGPDTVR